MAPILGKRKRRDQITESHREKSVSDSPSTKAKLQALFKQHFEAKFKPLPEAPQKTSHQPQNTFVGSEAEGSDGSDWSGLSDVENGAGVEVIEHTNSTGAKRIEVPKDEVKAFMTTKPPTLTSSTITLHPSKSTALTTPATVEEKADTLAHLKNDIALQRLLSESHLLSPPTTATSTSTPSSTNHSKTLSLRLSSLTSTAAASSETTTQKMPLAHRKGIIAKKKEREERRRKEARENGIVLEVERRGGMDGEGKGKGKRERGIGGPSVGKFKGGVLHLSERDLRSIQGPSGGRGRGRGGRVRGGRG
ncbi:MAG: hypothetical protein MMC33_001269 [Icmadophila ericetorum]|nr:hypothetical protein [Icmadophila ericetorum]